MTKTEISSKESGSLRIVKVRTEDRIYDLLNEDERSKQFTGLVDGIITAHEMQPYGCVV
jgi:hypothetical protein